MTKIELIKLLLNDVENHGDGEVCISITGNCGNVTLEIENIYSYDSGWTDLLCDIDKFYGGKHKFIEAIENVDDWDNY